MFPPIFWVTTWHGRQLLQYYRLYSLCCTVHPHDYSVTTSSCFLIPSPFPPCLQSPSPPASISLHSVSVRLFLFFLLFPLPKEIHQKRCCWEMSEILLAMFSSRSFLFSSLSLNSLIYFKFILVYGVRRKLVLFLCMYLPNFQHITYWTDCELCVLASFVIE